MKKIILSVLSVVIGALAYFLIVYMFDHMFAASIVGGLGWVIADYLFNGFFGHLFPWRRNRE